MSAAEEMRDDIGITVSARMQRLEPIRVERVVHRDRRVLAGEWGIADNCVETRVLAVENLGKFERPVEWHDSWCACSQFLDGRGELILPPGTALFDDIADLQPRGLAPPHPVGVEERLNDCISNAFWIGECSLRTTEDQLQLVLVSIIESGANALALPLDVRQSVPRRDLH